MRNYRKIIGNMGVEGQTRILRTKATFTSAGSEVVAVDDVDVLLLLDTDVVDEVDVVSLQDVSRCGVSTSCTHNAA